MRKLILLTILSTVLSVSCNVPQDPTESFNVLLFDWNNMKLGAKVNVFAKVNNDDSLVLFNYTNLRINAKTATVDVRYLGQDGEVLNRNYLHHTSETGHGITWDVESFNQSGYTKNTIEDDAFALRKNVAMMGGYFFDERKVAKTVMEVTFYDSLLKGERYYYLFEGDHNGNGPIYLVACKIFEGDEEIESEGDFTNSSWF